MDKAIIQNFHDTYLNPNIEELEELWQNIAPKSLIKFYSGNYSSDGRNYSLESIENGTLWLSSPACFNDPFDCVLNINYQSKLEEMTREVLVGLCGEETAERLMSTDFAKNTLLQRTAHITDELSMRNKNIENKIYVSCFSEIENLFSVTMWAHYANNHSGFCAEYSFHDINNLCKFGCLPVKYTNSHVRSDNPISATEGANLMLDLVYTKGSAWENEREWRFAEVQEEKVCNGYNIEFIKPNKIYLGCKVSQSLKDNIISICKKFDIELYQMKLKPGSFNLTYDVEELET